MALRLDRSFAVAAAFTLVGLAILLALGTWQMQRLSWKNDLIARAESRSQGEPAPLPEPEAWDGLVPEEYEYRAVQFTGRYLHEAEMHAYTVLSEPRGAHGGQGWWVMTPLELDGGGWVIVNRGFVPEDRKNAALRPQGQSVGEVSVQGLMRVPQRRGFFVPDDDIGNNVWFTRDPARMAQAAGLEGPVAPFFVDASGTPSGGLPQGGETRLSFRNDHLGYALTWYGLAATLIGVFAAWAWGRREGAQSSG